MNTVTLIGWGILILSWIVPALVKDKSKKSFWGAVLSATATGYFIGVLAHKLIG